MRAHLRTRALLALHLLEALLLLRLRVGESHRLHHLPLALELGELLLLLRHLRHDLLLAHAADVGALLHLLVVAQVLLHVHPTDRVLLLLVPPLLTLHLAHAQPLLQLDLPLALLHHIGEHELRVQRLDAVGRVVEHLVRAFDAQPPLLRLQRLLLAVDLHAQLLLSLHLLGAHAVLALAERLDGVGPLSLARIGKLVQPHPVLLLRRRLRRPQLRARANAMQLGASDEHRLTQLLGHRAGHPHGGLVRVAEERFVHIRRVGDAPAERPHGAAKRCGEGKSCWCSTEPTQPTVCRYIITSLFYFSELKHSGTSKASTVRLVAAPLLQRCFRRRRRSVGGVAPSRWLASPGLCGVRAPAGLPRGDTPRGDAHRGDRARGELARAIRGDGDAALGEAAAAAAPAAEGASAGALLSILALASVCAGAGAPAARRCLRWRRAGEPARLVAIPSAPLAGDRPGDCGGRRR